MKRARKGLSLELLFYGIAALCFWFTGNGSRDVAPGFDPALREANVIRVVSWNLGTGVDAGTQGLRQQDIDLVVTVLEELQPHLVFLQELRGEQQLRKLVKGLGPAWSWKMSQPATGRPLGILAQHGTLHSLQVPSLERGFAVHYKPKQGHRLVAVNMHADAFSAAKRNRSIGQATEFLRTLGENEPRLLLGDLNLDLGIDKRHDLFSDDEYLDVETYNHLAKTMLDIGIGRGATAKPDRRIDYIFLRERDFRVTQAGPLPGRRAPGMDHHPLVADLVARH